ncbi:type I polyketide synthase [Myxosarcina sp. GI1]|uniref:type I polyketide synthase n=1 Tax=Myxosarcina sp. GI1 TaxID=1541065 RepID=UPI00056A4B8F|nr:type I polyketide synthase [Myxosarcina sp. GI1]
MTRSTTGLEIAIIGLSGRFPKSKNIEAFWQNLIDGKELTSTLPDTTTAGGILEDVELFDASFFGFNPREAEAMDPQHRLFLECAWEALENAGYDSERETRPIGVYAGVGISTYLLYNLSHEIIKSRGFVPTLIGVDKDYLPTRVSYKLNLTGPSVSVGTACSSSLVAVHLACQSLLSGECDMALAAGVAVKVPQTEEILSPGQIVSPDGKCRAFAASANGTLGGNGIGVVVLKRLEDAIADRDYIYGTIKGSAINNDGALKVGYTAPSQEGQAKVIRSAQIMAEVEPESISYIEAHGTGTTLGDPIEIAALTQAFQSSTNKTGYCAIGSVKTNVGHLDAAAGITGLIKTALALDRQVIPPSLNFDAPNPEIDFKNSPFYVNTELKKWQTNGKLRRAAVSSFGFGGTNAHVILEEAPLKSQKSKVRSQKKFWQLLILSAKTSLALETATSNLIDYLEQHPKTNLADIAYTLQVGRRMFSHRRLVVTENVEDAVKALRSPERILTQHQEAKNRLVVFMFTGQGSQYVNMARELYETEPVFRQQCDRCFALLQSQSGLDLKAYLYPQADTEQAAQQLQQTAIAQPAIFVIEYALAKLWISWGIKPVAAIGHSIGEYVAATIAGVFSLEDALTLVTVRGQLMQQLPSGSMLAIPLSEVEIQPLLNENIFLAVINGKSNCVVSGTNEAIAALQDRLTNEGIDCRLLHTSHAFHSAMMEPILKPFGDRVSQIKLNPPQIPYVSNVTGTWITAEEATNPDYWTTHLRQTVRFAEGLQELFKRSDSILLEVGAGRTLSKLAKQHPDKPPQQVVLNSLRHPQEQQSDVRFLLNTLGQLWLAGVKTDWLGFYNGEKLNRIPLPTYPFERQRYWIEPSINISSGWKTKSLAEEESGRGGDWEKDNSIQKTAKIWDSLNKAGKKQDIADWFYVPSWKRSVLPISPLNPPKMGDFENHSPQTWGARGAKSESWLVFVDELGLGKQILKQLEIAGQKAIAIYIGDKFSYLGKNSQNQRLYAINPENRRDYEALFEELFDLNWTPSKILHLWSVTPEKQKEDVQTRGFCSLLFVVQALVKKDRAQKRREDLSFVVISNNLQSVTGEEVITPEKATILGAVKTIPLEYPHISCRSIDVSFPTVSEEKLAEQLITEVYTSTSDQIIAYRSKHRWIQTFEPVRLESKSSLDINLSRNDEETGGHGDTGINEITQQDRFTSATSTSHIREGGVYLITGGLGGIGLVIAEYLARTVKAKLVLCGRSQFPPRSQWKEWLHSHDESNSLSEKIRQIQALEALGAEVLVASADVSDRASMQALVNRVHARFGEINGIIHAAGVAIPGKIESRDKEPVETVFAAKVQGVLVLEKVFANTPLDFTVLFSSLSSLSGGYAVDYVAANAFLDAYAHYRNAKDDSFTVAINWDNWQTVGMASQIEVSEELKPFYLENQKNSIAAEEGIEAFKRILNYRLPQVVVTGRDLETAIAQHHSAKAMETQAEVTTQQLYPRPQLSNTYVSPRNSSEEILVELWQQLLGIDRVGIYDNFFELGGDSILSFQVALKAKEKGLQLKPNQLFEHPAIADLAKVVGIEKTEENPIDTAESSQQYTANLSQTELNKLLTKIGNKQSRLG